MNVELLEEVKRHFLEEPRRLEMETWLKFSPSGPPCQTVGCIAGVTLLLAEGAEPTVNGIPKRGAFLYRPADVEIRAKRLLDLPNLRLFHVSEWPIRLAEKFLFSLPQTTGQTAVLCAAVDDYVSTNGWGSEPPWSEK